ncbi:DUF4381 domain-containing protein [Motiliproteus coralliicola]|uniref:DUF4381 domain-containing protein n=1 Tax=Motiliproteus coralliicola TaxID=2283196 RepID=A0A369WS66_9GAMM|nr:DUF4381 domain-containing protein [Motiliproteus coralliicola]RDE24391.1 DUF4381 domain-containing protein [Motiliproteus coralliicola]
MDLPTSNTWLTNLHPPVMPPEPSLWPPAPGWWLLAVLLSGLVLIWAVRSWRLWRRDGYRRAALKELGRIRFQLRSDEHRTQALRALPQLLRRTALAASRQSGAADAPTVQPQSLSGSDWWGWLDRHWPEGRFSAGSGERLHRLAYASEAALDELSESLVSELCDRVEGWIRQHRRPELMPC